MSVHDTMEGFAAALPPMQALIGLDLGDKTTGVAVTSRMLPVATPLETIRRRRFGLDAERLMQIVADRASGGVILGLPRNMDGSEGPRCQSTRAFVRNLEKLTALPVVFWDERMSTMAVTRTLLDADASRARRAELVDKMAAAYILQGALDRLRKL